MEPTGYRDDTILSSGPDWLTCTAPKGRGSALLRDIFEEKASEDENSRLGQQAATRFGYQGLRAKGSFFGTRAEDACLVLSGPGIAPLARKAITGAANVSRFDLQITTWCGGSQPHIGLDAYRAVRAERVQSGRTGGVSLVVAHPVGECCYLNRRISDCFGRIYDKATEAKLGTARTVWRYEVEYKRKIAYQVAKAWAAAESAPLWTTSRVLKFFAGKGVPRSCLPSANQAVSCEVQALSEDRQTLRWLERTIRVTLRRQVEAHGLPRIIEALGLSHLVTINGGG